MSSGLPIGFAGVADYGEIGRPVLLYEGYKEWYNGPEAQEMRESGSTTDFPTYLDMRVRYMFMNRYDRVESNFDEFTRPFTVTDFKEIQWVSLTGFPELLPVPEGGPYFDAQITEVPGPKIKVGKFGRTFSLTFEAITNDDLNQFREVPTMMAEAAGMTLAIDVVNNTLENPGNAYDGTAFFHATHNNLGSTALSEASLAAAITTMRLQTDVDGRRINIRPAKLVVPAQLEFTARRIISDAPIYQPGTGLTSYNPVQGIVDVVVEPYLTDATDWYLFADPSVGRAPMVVAYLNGQQRPSVYLKDPSIRLLMGGMNHNPYNWEYDEIWWKIRHFWAVRMWEWRSVFKAAVAG